MLFNKCSCQANEAAVARVELLTMRRCRTPIVCTFFSGERTQSITFLSSLNDAEWKLCCFLMPKPRPSRVALATVLEIMYQFHHNCRNAPQNHRTHWLQHWARSFRWMSLNFMNVLQTSGNRTAKNPEKPSTITAVLQFLENPVDFETNFPPPYPDEDLCELLHCCRNAKLSHQREGSPMGFQ